MKVYKAISNVMADLAKSGISKDRKNQQQGYAFRGIDDVYNSLSHVMSQHGLVVLPRVNNRECVERQTKSGSTLFYVTVDVEYDFVCAEDGSKHTVRTFGEAMDSADKATNKAMSAAYKYAAIQAFCIPTEGDNDADATTHQIALAKQEALTDEAMMAVAQIEACGDLKTLGEVWAELSPEVKKMVAKAKDKRKGELA